MNELAYVCFCLAVLQFLLIFEQIGAFTIRLNLKLFDVLLESVLWHNGE